MSTAQHSTAQHSTAQHSTAQHSTAQHSTAQHSTAQHSTAQQKLGDYTQVEKLDLTSKDILSDNIAKIGQLFPEVLTESSDENGRLRPAIDFDKLRQFLSREIVEGRESYEFTWVGKRGAIAEAGKPTSQTLRPDLEESVDFDKSENVFITGDNLEVLKVLQESYLGKIDMIYIDPPYNTGKDFVYSDKFQMSEEELADEMDLRDEDGLQRVGLTRNEKSSARYHSDWLNMMYPRLVLARNLLKDSGVIFISIDDNEQANLKAICDEIFGEENLLSTHHIKVRYGEKNLNEKKDFQEILEYIYIYAKDASKFVANRPKEEYTFEKFNLEIEELKEADEIFYYKDRKVEVFKNGSYLIEKKQGNIDLFKETWISGSIYSGTGHGLTYQKIVEPRIEIDGVGAIYKIYGLGEDGLGYRYMSNPIKEGANRGKMFTKLPLEKREAFLNGSLEKTRPIINFYDFAADFGNIRHEGGIPFNAGKKPVKMLSQLINYKSENDIIVLDFFAGSSSTAHAVLKMNAQDGGNRKFIMCTLDEKAEGNKEYKTIDQISRERIRRAAKKIQEEHPERVGKQDFGFRAYKLDTSNFKDVSQTPDSFSQESLFESISNIKEDRTDLDLLFQIMLTWGMELSLPIAKTQIDGTAIYNVADGALIACFADEISESVLRQIAKEEPLRAVFKDESFSNSAAKINLGQIFKEEAPNTKVKVV
ncbi:site-specific DNA-methyltransferase [Streptococcus suis]|uniref:site-specific DNA-methyltransferase n=1 Tax=Streptococcus suis TaxID=1307 RepID=UPI003B9DCC67